MSVVDPDGRRYALRLIPPGEPLDRVGRFAVLTCLAILLHIDGWVEANNPWWIAVIERQRGPWRGYERIEVRDFERSADAAEFLMRTKTEIAEGRYSPLGPAAQT